MTSPGQRWTVEEAPSRQGGIYSLGGTAGQPDAGLSTGEVYVLSGGFWGGGAAAKLEQNLLFLPLVLRGY